MVVQTLTLGLSYETLTESYQLFWAKQQAGSSGPNQFKSIVVLRNLIDSYIQI